MSNKLEDITESLFMKIPAGCGDFLYFVIIAIIISNRYKNIYIYYNEVHFNSLNYLLNLFIESNNIKNIILISNPAFTNDNKIYDYKKYFDVFTQNHNFMELIKIDGNSYYSFLYDVNDNETQCYFIYALKIFNININNLFKINFFLSENDEKINNEYYSKVFNTIGENYIVIFNNNKDRYHDIFPIRQYLNEFNPSKIKIIYFAENFSYNHNEYFIGDILCGHKQLYHYNKIVEKSKAIFCINSFPAHYFNLIMNNINYKERFNNIQKNIFTRRFIGKNINNGYYINNINDIEDNNLKIFSNFNAYYPIFFFRNIINYPIKYYNDNGCSLLHYSGEAIYIDNNKFFNPLNDDDKNYLLYFTKILQNNISSNKYGISIYDKRFKNKNYININLKEKYIENEYIENLYSLNHEENQTIINKYLKENHLNILLVKFDTIYFIWCKERILNDNNEIISCDIENAPQIYLKIIEHFINNKWIDYIFPYKNEDDKNNYLNLLNS